MDNWSTWPSHVKELAEMLCPDSSTRGFSLLSITLPKIPDNSPRDLTSLTSLHTEPPLFDLSKSPTCPKEAEPEKHSALLVFQHQTISRMN